MLEFVLIIESPADARHISTLADRVFVERSQWIDESHLEHLRNWSGLEPNTPCTQWTEMGDLKVKYKLPRYRAHFSNQPKAPACAESRTAVALAVRMQPNRQIDALILFKDLDNQATRRDGMQQARQEIGDELAVVIATPKWKREAWILNGFECLSKREEELLNLLCQRLSFDPRLKAENLHHLTPQDSKIILDELMQDCAKRERPEREQQCWKTKLATLRERGKETLLAAYLDEVEERLLPLLDPAAPHQQS